MRRPAKRLLVFAAIFCALLPTSVKGAEHPRRIEIVLDAGHGGEDGGALAADGTKEADINLEIVLAMREILGLYGLQPVLTRDSSELNYPDDAGTLREKKVWDQNERLALITGIPNALFVSIHQNQYSAASAKGAEVLYAPTEGSKALAVWLQTLLVSEIDPQNRRTEGQISGDIWLMNRVDCPAVLVECGFLSNPEELELLKSNAYQQKLASVLVSGLLTWMDTYGEYGGIFHGENSVLLH